MPVVKVPTYPLEIAPAQANPGDMEYGRCPFIGADAGGMEYGRCPGISQSIPGGAAEECPIGSRASGTIAKFRTYQRGKIIVGGDPLNQKAVQLQYPYYDPGNAGTPAQLICQGNFRDGMAAWTALSPEEKETWNEKAREEHRNRGRKPGSYKVRYGVNLFLSDYLS